MEYYSRACKPSHDSWCFKKSDFEGLEKINEAETGWKAIESRFVPDDYQG